MSELVRYDAMCRAIAEAHAIDEVKEIRNRMVAMEAYARQALNEDAERQAREIRIRAERRSGQMLKEMMEMGFIQSVGKPSQKMSDDTTIKKLNDFNITRDQSSEWQKLAEIPEKVFEAALAENHPSTSGIIAQHETAMRIIGGEIIEPRSKQRDQGLWLWGRLLDFDRYEGGLLSEDPNTLLKYMSEHMRRSVRELAPKIAVWLGRIEDE